MIFKVIIFNSFSSKFFQICISFFNIAAKRTHSGSAINVCMYVYTYVCMYVWMITTNGLILGLLLVCGFVAQLIEHSTGNTHRT